MDYQLKNNLKGISILLLTAIVWGLSFVAQKVGIEQVKPMTFMGVRTLLGALTLLPFMLVSEKSKTLEQKKKENKKDLYKGGILCGLSLCCATVIQTYGMQTVSTGKSGFLTAMYIMFVPLIGVLLGKRLRAKTVISVIIALFGMYLLCMGSDSFGFGKGEILLLVCALFFALQILCVDFFITKTDAVKLSFMQFLVAGVISFIGALIFEKPDFSAVLACWLPIGYSGIFSCGVGYTCQVIGQRYAEPAAASIVMSLESVFSAVFGFLILNEVMSVREILGCIVMFAAIVYIQLPEKEKILSKGN